MTDLLQRVENSICSRKLISNGKKILLAVSGGLDSMVLLHALKKLSGQHKWKITVVHFNHLLRGRASDADESLVRLMAAKMKLPMVAERGDVKRFAKESKLSIEMAARKLRHEFFARVARKQKIKTIALAHHADDQVELFFLRLLRGAGGESLAGMKWQSPSPADKTILLVRPLLDLSKSELAEFGRENKIQFRDDFFFRLFAQQDPQRAFAAAAEKLSARLGENGFTSDGNYRRGVGFCRRSDAALVS